MGQVAGVTLLQETPFLMDYEVVEEYPPR